MLASIRRFFAPPVAEDENTARVAWLLNIVLLAFLVASAIITLVAAVFQLFRPDSDTVFTLLSGVVMTLCFGGLFMLARRGWLRPVSAVFLLITWTLVTVWIYTVSGISSDSSTLVYPLIVVLAGLLLGGPAAIIVTVITSIAVLGAYLAETSGLLVVVDRPISIADPFFVIIPLILTGVLLRYAMNSISQAIERAQRNERAQMEANRALERLRASLEQRVADRTFELERRSVQLQAATEVSRAATSILDVEELIRQVVELIQERFNLYHVGLFLLDESRRWAVYRSGAGEAGRRLREQGFRLEVGGHSMVGWCTANAQTRVAQDVRTEPIRIHHVVVPRTRSEAAIPLLARGQVLGAISVQSDRLGTFDAATVAALQTMAHQVAIALDNARLFTESQQALETTRRAYGQLSHEAWTELLRGRTDWGYILAHQTFVPVQRDWQPEMIEAMRTGQAVVRNSEPVADKQAGVGKAGDGAGGPILALPLKVREDVIGALSFHKDSADIAWTDDEMELLHRLVDQLGATLESAQLFQETQRRAAREQAIRYVTEGMRRSVDVETIVQNTLVELARTLGVPRAYVRLGTEAELLESHKTQEPDSSRGVMDGQDYGSHS
jgi:GAF domain-containing protein